MIGKFPTCALHITIAYEAVDVNVHPNKLEVRFRDEAGVYEAVLSAVLQSLKEQDAFSRPVEMQLVKEKQTPAIIQQAENGTNMKEFGTAFQLPVKTPGTVTVSDKLPAAAAVRPDAEKPMPEFKEVLKKAEQGEASRLPEGLQTTPVPDTAAPQAETEIQKEYRPLFNVGPAEQINSILPEIKEPMKIFGALFNTYILVEYKDQLLMVDQHAVHERLLFDKLMQEHEKENQPGQELLVPIIVSVTNEEMRMLEENRQALESIGLVIEAFGEKDVAVRTIPMILGEAQAKSFMTEVISELETGKDPTFEKKRTALLQTACKHAVKGGEPLSEDQLRSLLDEMIGKKVTPTCPHGRPLVVAITHRELDKKFKRIQQ